MPDTPELALSPTPLPSSPLALARLTYGGSTSTVIASHLALVTRTSQPRAVPALFPRPPTHFVAHVRAESFLDDLCAGRVRQTEELTTTAPAGVGAWLNSSA